MTIRRLGPEDRALPFAGARLSAAPPRTAGRAASLSNPHAKPVPSMAGGEAAGFLPARALGHPDKAPASFVAAPDAAWRRRCIATARRNAAQSDATAPGLAGLRHAAHGDDLPARHCHDSPPGFARRAPVVHQPDGPA